MSIIEQLVDEVIEKVVEGEALIKMVEKINVEEIEDEIIERLMEAVILKKQHKICNNLLMRIRGEVLKCDPEPLKYEDLKVGGKYLEVYFDGDLHSIYYIDVEKVKSDRVCIRYKRYDILKEVLCKINEIFLDEGCSSDIYTEFNCQAAIFYRIEE